MSLTTEQRPKENINSSIMLMPPFLSSINQLKILVGFLLLNIRKMVQILKKKLKL